MRLIEYINAILLCAVLVLGGYLVQHGVILFPDDGPYVFDSYKPSYLSKLSSLDLHAEHVLVYNLDREMVLLRKNVESLTPLASIVKLATGLVALEHLSKEVPITKQAIKQYGDTGIQLGERWPIRHLVSFMITSSSNDAAYALADAFDNKPGLSKHFFDELNTFADRIGAKGLQVSSPTGLDTTRGNSSAMGSAWDVLALVRFALKEYPELFQSSTLATQFYAFNEAGSHTAANTNKAEHSLPPLLISKTGYTESAGGNLVFAFKDEYGNTILVVLLESTYQGRFEDAKNIASVF